jgi:glutathione S-transferase
MRRPFRSARTSSSSALLTLYRAPFSTNVERVALALAHNGLAVESVWIEYSDRSAVERVSGQPLVPVLVDGDRVVVDSMEIVRYLEERHPLRPLYPADAARREEMLVFIEWFNQVWKVWPNSIEAGRNVHECSAAMSRALDRFERMLDGRDHLMGDEFSAADVAAFPFLKYALLRDPEDDEEFHLILEKHQPLDGHPRLAAWIRRVSERPRA